MSVLDMLCCGFGAAALLLILRELQASAATEKVREKAEQSIARVHEATKSLRRYTQQLERIEAVRARHPPNADDGAGVRAFGISLENVRRAIVILDTSGSMRVYTQSQAAKAATWDAADKWKRTTAFVDDLLLATPQLESVAILRIDDQGGTGSRCEQCFIAGSASDPWIGIDGESLATLHERMSALAPSGGSNHLPALNEALRLIQESESSKPVDAVFLLTDGLPNAATQQPVPSGTPRTCVPQDRCVQVADKRKFADQVVAHVAPELAAIHARRESFRFHVIGIEWPDDAELPAFALALAAPTRGMVIFPTMSAEEGGT